MHGGNIRGMEYWIASALYVKVQRPDMHASSTNSRRYVLTIHKMWQSQHNDQNQIDRESRFQPLAEVINGHYKASCNFMIPLF